MNTLKHGIIARRRYAVAPGHSQQVAGNVVYFCALPTLYILQHG